MEVKELDVKQTKTDEVITEGMGISMSRGARKPLLMYKARLI